jgi:hypothetical protein
MENATAVGQIWESPSLREKLGAKAKQTSQRRSWEHFAKSTETAFEYAIDHPKG